MLLALTPATRIADERQAREAQPVAEGAPDERDPSQMTPEERFAYVAAGDGED